MPTNSARAGWSHHAAIRWRNSVEKSTLGDLAELTLRSLILENLGARLLARHSTYRQRGQGLRTSPISVACQRNSALAAIPTAQWLGCGTTRTRRGAASGENSGNRGSGLPGQSLVRG